MKSYDTYYYSDLLNDDFANTNIESKPLPDDFKYFHESKFYHFVANTIYFLIAKPFIFFYRKLVWRHKIIGKDKFKIKGGYFIYGNHTQRTADAVIPNSFSYPRRNYIIVNNDAFAIPYIKTIVSMVGGVPLSDKITHKKELLHFIKESINLDRIITIYPEAHIWPYYTKIRPFEATSFKYPAKFNSPVFAFTNCYQKKGRRKRPQIITYIDGPFYPDMNLSLNDRALKLRNEVYDAMTSRTLKYSTYEFVNYIYKEKTDK